MPAAPDVALSPASTLSSDRLAAVFTAGYEGYWFPIRLDADAFAAMAETHDLDLGASRVAVAAGSDVGVAVLGARGTEGWIGAWGSPSPGGGRASVAGSCSRCSQAAGSSDIGI